MQALRIGIAAGVAVVWVGTYGRYMVVGGTVPPSELSWVMLAVVAAVLGVDVGDVVRRRRNGGDDGG